MDSGLFAPKSIAVIGASERAGSIGRALVVNLIDGGFAGPLWLVNPKHERLFDRRCFARVRELPGSPDLAVIAVPARSVAAILHQLGQSGLRLAVIVSAGFAEPEQQSLLGIAAGYGMRLLGPNCLGLLLPHARINASFAPSMPAQGGLAFLSQSGAILTSALDWVAERSIGFSGLVSLGNAVDLDMADMLDQFAEDPKTTAILVYLEAVRDGRRFLAAARRAAGRKPVVVMKVGRHAEGARAALSHTGALAGSDLVYGAAFRRCGLVRVMSLEELFDAAALLSVRRPFTGEQLAIVTNGGGAGIIAADRLKDLGGRLAVLSDETMTALNDRLPASWSLGNPVDIVGDADAKRYADALRIVLDDAAVHVALVLRCPTSVASGEAVAKIICDVVEENRCRHDWHKPVLTCWLGGETVRAAREIFRRAGIPTFDSPEDAIRAVAHLFTFARARETTAHRPEASTQPLAIDEESARKLLEARMQAGETLLSERDAKALIAAYGIPVAATEIAADAEAVEEAASRLLSGSHAAQALVLKIVSPDITHKSDVGGVRLDIRSAAQARSAASDMLASVARRRPDARLSGIAVQPMIRKPHGRQLILGINRDATFGATLLFGAGGTAVEVLDDKSVELAPLDDHLARAMIARTRIARLLAGYRHVPAVPLAPIVEALIGLSRLAVDFPQIAELDINPLLADENGIVALDARAVLSRTGASGGDAAVAYWSQGQVDRRAGQSRPLRA